jgi:LCP family protein required for cell wall assembly
MEPSYNRRRETKIRRQITKTAFGNSQQPVPKVVPARTSPGYSRAYNMDGMRTAAPRRPARINIEDRLRDPRPRVQTSVKELAKAVVAVEAFRPAPAPVKTPVPARHMPPMDMDLPGNESPLRHLDSLLRFGRFAAVRRWTFRGAAAAIVLVLVVGGFLFSQGFFNVNKSFHPAALKTDGSGLLKGEADGRINILLMGRGGGNHDGPDLTDTMMIDSIDVVNHTSTLISVPRDLWVDVPNQGTMKINAAFESGEFKYLGKEAPGSTNPNAIQAGFDEADQVVESVLGVTIHYNALVSFQAFQQAVDTVGGVGVNVPKDLVDPTMAWENGNNPVLAKAGADKFNGKQALNYVRSRETTSDFARAQRQRAVMVALKTKVETVGTLSNPWKIAKLAKAFGDNVHSDLSLKDAARLYGIIKKVPDNKTSSVGLSDAPNNYVTTGTLAGQSIALPSAGLFNYGAIQAYMRTQLKDPYLLKENARMAVLNGTPIEGLAGTKANQLKAAGYNVVQTGNAPTTNYIQTTVVDLTGGKDKHTRHYLEQRLGVTAINELPDNKIQKNGVDFVIILGSDEAPPSQN